MDLNSYAIEDEPVPMPLMMPDGKAAIDETTKQPVTISLYGHDSGVYRDSQRVIQNRNLNMMQSSGRTSLKAEQLEDDALTTLVACTAGWQGIVVDKAVLDFNPATVRMVYTRFPWVREQAERWISDRRNYLKNS